MKTSTKSILFGIHCFLIHPFFVAYAWYKLYGFPKDIRLWVAFFVHDLGYWGCENMDDEAGEQHPYFGAKIMHKLFDTKIATCGIKDCPLCKDSELKNHYWYNFTLYHSRFLAKRSGAKFSKLCVADKLAICLTPKWLYLPMANWSGEIKEYMKDSVKNTGGFVPTTNDQIQWKNGVDVYVKNWVEEHKDMKEDTWTSANRQADNNGVWK